ncbi:MAG: FkbM family methyltransferase [Kovacikia sp.]
MSLQFFLYRRLSRLITCQLRLPGSSKIQLQNKYEVASFQDVFCHPFYWQIFSLIETPPALVVDCGAHCGHFSILADTCFRTKFNSAQTEYLLIEPNPRLMNIIQTNLRNAELTPRSRLIQGLLGVTSGQDVLWVNPKNYLVASLTPSPGLKPHTVQYVDLEKLVGDRTIDLMKVDIEGAEYEFVKQNPSVFRKANLVLFELHGTSQTQQDELFASLQAIGLSPIGKPIESQGNQLIIFQRQLSPSPDESLCRI